MKPREANVALPEGYELLAFEEIDSTSDHAKRIATTWFDTHAGQALWILADRQTQGRGRRGRHWETVGGNFAATLLLRPNISVDRAAQLSFVAALAVAGVLEDVLGGGVVALKWPNDVLVHDKKIAGILLESSASSAMQLDWVSIGIGINLQSYPSDVPFPATSLKEAHPMNMAPKPETLLGDLAIGFDKLLDQFLDEGIEPIRKLWLDRARGVGEPIVARLFNEEIEGVFQSLTPDGALIIRLQSGEERVISAGEVFFPQNCGQN